MLIVPPNRMWQMGFAAREFKPVQVFEQPDKVVD